MCISPESYRLIAVSGGAIDIGGVSVPLSLQHFFADLLVRVLGAVFEVSNTLGAGFLEKVYQRALLHERRLRGIRAAAELVIELKCAERLFTNTPPSVSTICEPRAGLCARR